MPSSCLQNIGESSFSFSNYLIQAPDWTCPRMAGITSIKTTIRSQGAHRARTAECMSQGCKDSWTCPSAFSHDTSTQWPKYTILGFSSVQFSRSVVSESLQPHESQHARPPCPSPTPRVYPNSCPLSRWCHPTISSSVVPFSSCPQSFPASGSFQMSQLFAWGGQSSGVSVSTSVLPMNTQDWSPLGWTSWISLQSKGLSRVFSNTTVQKHQFFSAQLSLWSNSHSQTWLLMSFKTGLGCFSSWEVPKSQFLYRWTWDNSRKWGCHEKVLIWKPVMHTVMHSVTYIGACRQKEVQLL